MQHNVKAWMVNMLVFIDPDASVLEALQLDAPAIYQRYSGE